MEKHLIPLEAVNAVEIFTADKIDALLAAITKEVGTLVADVSTPEGRKDIASWAYKIARSKTTIDEAGKALVADWKKRSAEVDGMRKKARDTLDALKDKVRARLAEEARIRAEEERRTADREHRKKINNTALKAFVDEGIQEDTAKKVLNLIASGSIPAVSIKY